jgi:DNA-binding NarL/FixJ family response regulator
MKVLVADGSQVVVERMLTLMREIPNVEPLTPAYHAQATLDSMRANDPELLIVDMRIPGAKEMDLLATIRREKPKAILIILSNLTCPQYQKQAKALGADIFMDKSNEFVRLSQLVRELASSSFDDIAQTSKDNVHNQLAHSKYNVGNLLCLFTCVAASLFIATLAQHGASGLSTRDSQVNRVQTTPESRSFRRVKLS